MLYKKWDGAKQCMRCSHVMTEDEMRRLLLGAGHRWIHIKWTNTIRSWIILRGAMKQIQTQLQKTELSPRLYKQFWIIQQNKKKSPLSTNFFTQRKKGFSTGRLNTVSVVSLNYNSLRYQTEIKLNPLAITFTQLDYKLYKGYIKYPSVLPMPYFNLGYLLNLLTYLIT